jgi:hypothetical protein
MRKAVVLLGLLLVPATVLAQGRGARRPGMGGGALQETNIVERVLEHKTDFALSSEQVSKLESLAKQVDEKQKPIQEQLRKQREAGVRPRDLTEAQREEMRKLMEKARETREWATDELEGVLNDEQEAKLKALVERARERRGGRA